MRLKWREAVFTNNRTLRTALALLLPFALMVFFVLVTPMIGYISGRAEPIVGLASLFISAAVGFAMLITSSKIDESGRRVIFVAPSTRRYAIGIGLLYFPVMVGLLQYFGLLLVGVFFGETL